MICGKHLQQMDEDEDEDEDDEGEDDEESDTNDDELDTDMMDDRDSGDDASTCKFALNILRVVFHCHLCLFHLSFYLVLEMFSHKTEPFILESLDNIEAKMKTQCLSWKVQYQ